MKNVKDNQKEKNAFFDATLMMHSREEAEKFFSDVATFKELEALSQRLEVAKLLANGVTYSDISEQTGASTATISRVNRALMHGSGGYNIALSRIKECEEKEREKVE